MREREKGAGGGQLTVAAHVQSRHLGVFLRAEAGQGRCSVKQQQQQQWFRGEGTFVMEWDVTAKHEKHAPKETKASSSEREYSLSQLLENADQPAAATRVP